MNVPSVEIGWIIISENPDALFEKAKQREDENGFWIPDDEGNPVVNQDDQPIYIETHPQDEHRVFVSFWEVSHGFPLDGVVEPRYEGSCVLAYIKSLDPKAAVCFGIIETER